jgi:hypothetical protein
MAAAASARLRHALPDLTDPQRPSQHALPWHQTRCPQGGVAIFGSRALPLRPVALSQRPQTPPEASAGSFFPPAAPADVGSGTPGTDSSQFSSQHFQAWRPAFFARLAAQAGRAARAIGCTCGRCGAPRVVAFSGKRQFQELFLGGGGGGGGKKSPGKGPWPGQAASGTGPRQAEETGPPQPHNDCSSAGDGPGLDGLSAAAPAPAPVSGATEAAEAPGEGPQQAAQQGPARAPTLQARRPSRLEVGRQWVLPEGWPLPLDTEVRCRRRSRSSRRFCLLCVRVQSDHVVSMMQQAAAVQASASVRDERGTSERLAHPLQPGTARLPPTAPHPQQHMQVWVMTSTSGAAPMSNEQRLAPWRALAQRLQGEAWPQRRMPLCAGGASAAAAHGGGRTAGRPGS